MFVRIKRSGEYEYLRVVHNERFAQRSVVLTAHRQGRVAATAKVRIGPPLVFGRLREELGLPKLLGRLLEERKFAFDVQRAIFVTVLHRLFAPGSDRAAEVWQRQYAMPGTEGLQLQHFYRAMAWLGESLPDDQQAGATPLTPRCVKDRIEESLFAESRDLFTSLELVFFDTTSIYFEGEGGEGIGQYGHSKDHRESICVVADRLPQRRPGPEGRRRPGGDPGRLAGAAEAGGHVFCSFLALMLLKELLERLKARGWQVEWTRLRDDLDALEEITVQTAGRSFVVRSAVQGDAGKATQAAGVALGPAIRLCDDTPPLPPAKKGPRSAKTHPC